MSLALLSPLPMHHCTTYLHLLLVLSPKPSSAFSIFSFTCATPSSTSQLFCSPVQRLAPPHRCCSVRLSTPSSTSQLFCSPVRSLAPPHSNFLHLWKSLLHVLVVCFTRGEDCEVGRAGGGIKRAREESPFLAQHALSHLSYCNAVFVFACHRQRKVGLSVPLK